MPRPRKEGHTFNGVQLGLGSPFIKTPPRRQYFGPSEFQVQSQLIDLIKGPLARDGPHVGKRVPGAGYTTQYPDLAFLYAVPNGGHRLKGAAGKAKAEGVLETMCDLVLPAARYPFHGLYLEMKTPAGSLSAGQKATMLALLAMGYASVEGRGTQEGLDCLLAYVQLPRWPEPPELLVHRDRALRRLTPHPLRPPTNGR